MASGKVKEVSIARNSRVDGSGPGIDATRKRLNAFETLIAEPHGDAEGSRTVVAKDYDRSIGIEFGMGAGGHVAHRHQHRVRQRSGLELPGLAYIEQERGVGLLT